MESGSASVGCEHGWHALQTTLVQLRVWVRGAVPKSRSSVLMSCGFAILSKIASRNEIGVKVVGRYDALSGSLMWGCRRESGGAQGREDAPRAKKDEASRKM